MCGIGPRAVGEFGHHHGLACAGDPSLEQRRHAVGHLVLARAVALDEKARRPARQRPDRDRRIGAAGHPGPRRAGQPGLCLAGRPGPCRAARRSRRRPGGQARCQGRRGSQARRQRQSARPLPGPHYRVRHPTGDRFDRHDVPLPRGCWCCRDDGCGAMGRSGPARTGVTGSGGPVASASAASCRYQLVTVHHLIYCGARGCGSRRTGKQLRATQATSVG